jgi:autotransporter adhesin
LGGFTSDNSSGAFIPRAVGADSSAGGAGSVASGARSAAVGNTAQATADNATAIGHAAVATGANSVALGAGSSDGGEANVVSVGTAANARRITNVSNGRSATDAVNLQQLQAAMNQSMAASNAYVDQRVAMLYADISSLRRDANAGTAAAMAIAAIPTSSNPGEGMVGGGVGVWQGQSAYSVGLSKSVADGRIAFKAGGVMTSQGQAGGSAGFGIRF